MNTRDTFRETYYRGDFSEYPLIQKSTLRYFCIFRDPYFDKIKVSFHVVTELLVVFVAMAELATPA